MPPPKDLFSKQSDEYAKYRPTYPKELYDWIISLLPGRQRAWDCATGNGQVAVVLSEYVEEIEATDISQAQLNKAVQKPNISYQVSQAESTPFPNDSFELITVAQALHWFEFDSFFQEVKRVLKPNGIVAIWGYGLLRIHPEIDPLLDYYYTQIIGPYWAPERKHVDRHYVDIDFPFEEIHPPYPLFIERKWTLKQFEGYLTTWSALQSYLAEHGNSPIPAFIDQIHQTGCWAKELTVRFPIFTRVARL